MNRAFKFRIYPNREQQELIAKTFGCVRFVYNQMLSDRIEHYKATGKSLNNTPAAYKKEYEWLREVDSLALANAQMNLNKAYANFFRDKSIGFPKFKSKKKNHKSYTTNVVNGNLKLGTGELVLPKLKAVKIKKHREIPADYILKSVTISQTATGKYFASLLYAYEQDIKVVEPKVFLGLDYSMKELSRALHFGKSVSDNGFGMFVSLLDYKLKDQGKDLVKIDKWFPSSKLCSACGEKKAELSLSERIYHCEACGIILDRDYNASINIKNEGMRMTLA